LLFVGAVLLVGYLVWQLRPEYLREQEDPRSREFLSSVAAEINRSTPVMIDRETELLPSEVADGVLVYNYRLVNFSTTKIDHARFAAAARTQVTEGACNTPETRDGLLKIGVTLRYAYFDKDKQPIATVDVAPADCGF
jgi:hypothetical protein